MTAANNLPTAGYDDVGWITADQMVEVDRVMIDDLGISLMQMMENAGRNLAELIVALHAPQTVAVLCGSGGNGGGGLVAARHLANRGVAVTVTLGSEREKMGPVPAHQLRIVEAMDLPLCPEPPPVDVTVDALIGYSLRGAPRGRVAELIDTVNASPAVVLALDTPSGLQVTSGETPGVVISADATMTLAIPKVGLRAAPQVGQLFLADISVPTAVYGQMGVGPVPDFRHGTIVELQE